MREMEVLGNGHLKLDFADWKDVFETVMAKQMRPASEAGPFLPPDSSKILPGTGEKSVQLPPLPLMCPIGLVAASNTLFHAPIN